MDQLDIWLNFREAALADNNLGDSIDAVEELLRKHDDFEKTVEAQEDKFNAIRRLTLVGHVDGSKGRFLFGFIVCLLSLLLPLQLEHSFGSCGVVAAGAVV